MLEVGIVTLPQWDYYHFRKWSGIWKGRKQYFLHRRQLCDHATLRVVRLVNQTTLHCDVFHVRAWIACWMLKQPAADYAEVIRQFNLALHNCTFTSLLHSSSSHRSSWLQTGEPGFTSTQRQDLWRRHDAQTTQRIPAAPLHIWSFPDLCHSVQYKASTVRQMSNSAVVLFILPSPG